MSIVTRQIIKHGIKETIVNIGLILLLITALVVILNILRALKLILALDLVITKDLIFISKPEKVVVNYLVFISALSLPR